MSNVLHELFLDSMYKCGYLTIYTKLEVLTCEAGGVMDPAGPGPGWQGSRAMLQWAYADVECGAATSYTAADPCPLQPTAYICLFAFIHHIPHRYNDLNITSGIL